MAGGNVSGRKDSFFLESVLQRILYARASLEAGKLDTALMRVLEGMLQAPALGSLSEQLNMLMRDPRLVEEMRKVMENCRVAMHPHKHAFLFYRKAYRSLLQVEAPASAPRFPDVACQEGDSIACKWPPPKYASWLCGRQCPVVNCGGSSMLPAEALQHVVQAQPCILRDLNIFPAACDRWSFDYFSGQFNQSEFSVFTSKDGDYSYWYGKPNSAGFLFSNPTEREALTFCQFLERKHQTEAEPMGCRSCYLQEALYHSKNGEQQPLRREVMSAEMVRDWERGLSWAALDQVQHAGGFGKLNTSTLFCSGRGAYSRPHYDQSSNLYLQVRGAKRWLLFAPEDGPMLYPYPKGHPLDRKSRLDFASPQLDAFPLAAGLRGRGMLAVIRPGDALYLPSHWWHAVHSLEPETLAVNFWWPPSPNPSLMPWQHAAVELARDLESVMQEVLGPPSVEEFLHAWQEDAEPRTPDCRRLRCMLLLALVGLLRSGSFPCPEEVSHVLRFLDARRYAGLLFRDPAAPAPAPAACLQPSARPGAGAPRRAVTVGAGGAFQVARSRGQGWHALESCRKGSALRHPRRGERRSPRSGIPCVRMPSAPA